MKESVAAAREEALERDIAALRDRLAAAERERDAAVGALAEARKLADEMEEYSTSGAEWAKELRRILAARPGEQQ